MTSEKNKGSGNTYLIKKISENGYPIVKGPEYCNEVNWNTFRDQKLNIIPEYCLYMYISKKFIYNSELKAFEAKTNFEPYSKLFLEELKTLNSRVPFEKTLISKYPDFEGGFVSNCYFCNLESSLMLGLFDCLLRSKYNKELLEKLELTGSRAIFNNHFKSIYEFLISSNNTTRDFKIRLAKRLSKYSLKEPSMVQCFSDDFNVGVVVYYYHKKSAKYKKFMILPQYPEITPVPLIQLIKYSRYTCVFYSELQNQLDGFNEIGTLEKSSESESIPFSFYTAENQDTYNENHHIDTIGNLCKLVNEISKEKKDKIKIINIFDSISKTLEDESNKSETFKDSLKTLKQARESLNKVLMIIDEENDKSSKVIAMKNPSQKKSIKKSLSVYDTDSVANASRFPRLLDNGLPISSSPKYDYNFSLQGSKQYFTPNSPLSSSNSQFYINSSANIPVSNYEQLPEINYRINPIGSAFNGLASPANYQYDQRKNLLNQNLIKNDPSAPNILSSNPLGLTSSNKKETCLSCNQKKICFTIHNNCKMCQGCIISIFHSDKPKCYVCGHRVEGLKKTVFIKLTFSCESCKNILKNPELNSCGCVLCAGCKISQHLCPEKN
ncbi:hypothetical protein SteCoe_21811 [Stentor coeruleus]|uniref:Uncharacterized protein n=1 Tax=Stentor coeruleus TaxID=5963 RepID=A0A1R2BNW4_9CILI|nr:hypothetical protein SteCoe_21811 [Stentor coeruleus]